MVGYRRFPWGGGFSFFLSDSTLLVKLLGKSGMFWNLGDLHLIAVIVTDFSLASPHAESVSPRVGRTMSAF